MNSTTPSSSPTPTKKEILPSIDNNKTDFLNTPNITPKQYVENNFLSNINKSLTSNLMKSFEPKKSKNNNKIIIIYI